MFPYLLNLMLLLTAIGCGREVQEQHFSSAFAQVLKDGGLRVPHGSLRFITIETFGSDTVPALVRAPGRVAFRDGAVSEVGAPVPGRIVEVYVRLGQHVHRGEPLFAISSQAAALLRAELARSDVMLRAAEAEASRQRQMMERGVGVQADLLMADARVAEQRALLAGLRSSAKTLGRGSATQAIVRSPLEGVVIARAATVGLTVDVSGTSLMTIGDPSSVRVVIEVFERELPLIKEGASASVSLASLPMPLSARVDAVGGSVDPQTRRAPVYLSLLDTVTQPLRSGMYARATIEAQSDTGRGIPTTAVLIKGPEKTIVFVARDSNIFEPRNVEVGHPVEGRVPVLSGLNVGERVVTRGALLLDGAAEILR